MVPVQRHDTGSRRRLAAPMGYPARMARQRDLDHDGDEDDAALFLNAIGPVRSLPDKLAKMPTAPSKPRPFARMAERDEDHARDEFKHAVIAALEAGDTLAYRRDEVPPQVLKRLARGEYAVQEELDLHGLPARTAEALLRDFLRDCRAHGVGCARIVHGKGRNSEERLPVLKNLVDRVLRRRADVLAFHSAPAAQGSTGAVLVLLAR